MKILRYVVMLSAMHVHAESVVEQWVKRYNGASNGNEHSWAVAIDSSGNVIVAGYSIGSNGNRDFHTVKYAAADGALLWEKRYNGMGNLDDEAVDVAVDDTGNAIVTGYTITSVDNLDYYTVKYAATDGHVLWERSYNGPNNVRDEAVAVELDGAGNAIVTGNSFNASRGSDMYTAKYSAADGTLLWGRRYNGASNTYDYATAVAVDSLGNITVVGNSMGTNSQFDYCTLRYAGTDGALLWEKRYDGPTHTHDYPNAVAVDNAGNAIVTGWSTGNGNNYDYYTAKYAAGDGTLLWEKRYNGPGNAHDFGETLVLDSVGNAIVTGAVYLAGINPKNDFYTAKYAAADGALLWEKHYNGPGNGDDIAFAAVLDSMGNAIVAGSSFGNGTSNDFYVAKYAAADGALLLEKRYNAPTNGSDRIDHRKQMAITAADVIVITGNSLNGLNADYVTVKYASAIDTDNDGLLDPWELGRFGTTVGHSALDDSDGDGRVELIEMAFASDPLVPDAKPAPIVVVEADYLTTTIIKQPGVGYEVQTAALPEAPRFSASTTTVIIDTETILKVRDNVRIVDVASRFLRVKVSSVR